MHGFEGMGGGWMIFWWILIILAIAVITGWLVQRGRPPRNDSSTNKSAEKILDERYARGEIDREEYRQKKKDLKDNE